MRSRFQCELVSIGTSGKLVSCNLVGPEHGLSSIDLDFESPSPPSSIGIRSKVSGCKRLSTCLERVRELRWNLKRSEKICSYFSLPETTRNLYDSTNVGGCAELLKSVFFLLIALFLSFEVEEDGALL